MIRRLGPGHAAAYRQLMLGAYARHPDAFTSTAEERAGLPLDWWKKRLSTSPAATESVWGAFIGRGLVGVAGLERQCRTKTRHRGKVFGMYVKSSKRGSGIGRKLLKAVIASARRRKLRQLHLTVTEGNTAACGLYARAGFQAWGTEPSAVLWRGRSWAKVHYALCLRR
jgi:ribosomal protein S18 acetylase RimI-like enzyme